MAMQWPIGQALLAVAVHEMLDDVRDGGAGKALPGQGGFEVAIEEPGRLVDGARLVRSLGQRRQDAGTEHDLPVERHHHILMLPATYSRRFSPVGDGERGGVHRALVTQSRPSAHSLRRLD
jgi:hypothetical protein